MSKHEAQYSELFLHKQIKFDIIWIDQVIRLQNLMIFSETFCVLENSESCSVLSAKI